MSLPPFIPNNNREQWDRYCDLNFFNDEMDLWLDISRMNISQSDFSVYKNKFNNAFSSMKKLEEGSIANIDERRQVGHYWLRNPELSPDKSIATNIEYEIRAVSEFGINILKGNIRTKDKQKFTDVLWIGIGGSSLGPKLIVESLQNNGKGLNFHFLDNVDPHGIADTISEIGDKFASTLIVIVSKSGGTPEPLIGMEQIRYYLDNESIDWPSQAVAITMNQSKLDILAKSESWLKRFDLPDWVGGRTSITSSVGLLPITLVGEDINQFLEGASIMDEITRNTDIKDNPSALLSLSWLKSGEGKGLRDMVVLPYQDRLQIFSRYLQQLVMESLGKKLDRQGNKVNQGLAVYGNKGSTDQHAYVQQLRDGIDNFFVTFIEVLEGNDSINKVNNKHPGEYLSGFLQGTRNALTEAGRQSLTISIKKFDTKALGSLIALFERAVGLYAELIDINAYDQPGVEAGKKAAADVLLLQDKIIKELDNSGPLTLTQIKDQTNTESVESIFLIIRHLVLNYSDYSFKGDWNNPDKIVITKNNL